VHKTANVLDKLPKRLQPEAKEKLHQIWMAETRADAEQAFDLFLATYQAKYPKATECLAKDRTVLLTFYDFPAEAVWANRAIRDLSGSCAERLENRPGHWSFYGPPRAVSPRWPT
jgi:transposase-like protein